MFTLKDVKVPEDSLIKKGYRAADILGKEITVTDVVDMTGDKGNYIVCAIESEELEAGRDLVTGAKNIVARLIAAKEQGMLPITVTVVKLGDRAFDII